MVGLDHPQSQEYIQSRLRNHDKGGDEKVQLRKVGIRDRVGCYTWTWFTMTMATGGIANVLHASRLTGSVYLGLLSNVFIAVPYRSDWLRIIGTVVFLFNLCLFVINCILLSLRFYWNPGSFKGSFISQSESLFIPASVSAVNPRECNSF